jgi:hypothetical protein
MAHFRKLFHSICLGNCHIIDTFYKTSGKMANMFLYGIIMELHAPSIPGWHLSSDPQEPHRPTVLNPHEEQTRKKKFKYSSVFIKACMHLEYIVSWAWWLRPVISATRKAEIRRFETGWAKSYQNLISINKLGMVVQACNSSYRWCISRRIMV